MPLKVNVALEESPTAGKNRVPADVAQMIAKISDRVKLGVAILASEGVDHVCCEPMTRAKNICNGEEVSAWPYR